MHRFLHICFLLVLLCPLLPGCGRQKGSLTAVAAWDTVTCAWYSLRSPVPLPADFSTAAQFPQEVKQFLSETDCRSGRTADGSLQVSANVFVYTPDIVCSVEGAAAEAAGSMAKAEGVRDFSFTACDTVLDGRPAILQRGRWLSGKTQYGFTSLLAAEKSVLWQFLVIFDTKDKAAGSGAEALIRSVRLTGKP